MRNFTTLITLLLLCASCWEHAPSADENYIYNHVEAPFEMEPIREFIFPDRDFVISEYGATADTTQICTDAIAAAIEACHKAGGGRVVVPAGEWLTGAIHFKSNVNLHLSEGATLYFAADPQEYLPAVECSWNGMECYNYSPLLYAYACENIAISGKGTLRPIMDVWEVWFERPAANLAAMASLYHQASQGVDVKERQMAQGENNMRPHLIHFNRCRNVCLSDFTIRESPFWTIHIYMCDNAILRGVDVRALGHNNDGVDVEMSRNVLIERCTFDQGDDAVVIKSGRNRDAWRLDTPSENIVIRECNIINGHTLLGVGSELSGGVRNVYMHDCQMPGEVFRLLFIKTNHRRGGVIENIYMDNIKAGKMKYSVFEIDTDVLYQWRDLVPTYQTSITKISNIYMSNIEADESAVLYRIAGDEREKVKGINLESIKVGKITSYVSSCENAEDVKVKNISYTFEGE